MVATPPTPHSSRFGGVARFDGMTVTATVAGRLSASDDVPFLVS
jgi:hypothetical protein